MSATDTRPGPGFDEDDEHDDPRDRLGCWQVGLIGCGILGLVVLVGLGMLGFAMERGLVPDSALTRGEDLSDRTRARIAEIALEDGETIVWFYSSALFDVAEDANILTDQRVISYGEDLAASGGPAVASIRLEDVAEVHATFSDSFLVDSDLWVWPAEGVEPADGIYLWLSPEEDRDHAFVHDLVNSARRAGAAVDTVLLAGASEARDFDRIEGAARGDD